MKVVVLLQRTLGRAKLSKRSRATWHTPHLRHIEADDGGGGRCGASGPYGDMKDDGGARWTCLWSGRGSGWAQARRARTRRGPEPPRTCGRNRGSASEVTELTPNLRAEARQLEADLFGPRPGPTASRRAERRAATVQRQESRKRPRVREGGTRRDPDGPDGPAERERTARGVLV